MPQNLDTPMATVAAGTVVTAEATGASEVPKLPLLSEEVWFPKVVHTPAVVFSLSTLHHLTLNTLTGIEV